MRRTLSAVVTISRSPHVPQRNWICRRLEGAAACRAGVLVIVGEQQQRSDIDVPDPKAEYMAVLRSEVLRDSPSYDPWVPLGTVVRDVYAGDERQEMYEALDVLLRAGFHRAGVYCYWDPDTRQPFYIGLAKDLAARFAQHNGLKGCRPGKGNKGKQINDWFSVHERLGFSVVLQEGLADETYEPFARNAEGQLLEGYRRVHGALRGGTRWVAVVLAQGMSRRTVRRGSI